MSLRISIVVNKEKVWNVKFNWTIPSIGYSNMQTKTLKKRKVWLFYTSLNLSDLITTSSGGSRTLRFRPSFSNLKF